jgi:hypothetical protein
MIGIARVSEHLSKMVVLSGVFNTRILDATNYANQDYMRVNYALIVASPWAVISVCHVGVKSSISNEDGAHVAMCRLKYMKSLVP